MSDADAFLTEYTEALSEHLATGSEATLSQAYEFGRRAVEGGIVELTGLHHRAISQLAVDGDDQSHSRVARAADFFAEVVSPLEMALRSYRETTAALLELNERLEHQNLELTRAKEAADAANRELEAFSYSVSHDLRAPLRTIDGFSRVVLEDHAETLDEDGRHALERVRRASQRMGDLIDDMLRLARISRADMRIEDVDISGLAERIAAELGQEDPEREVDFAIEGGISVRGDARLLGVVMDNLVRNSWKYTSKRDQARIQVSATQTDGKQTVVVRDNGAGFDMTYADKLFQEFQRLHSDSEFEGTGVGLATVLRVVNRHGGKIWAEGAVDEGAAFYFTL